MITEKAAREEEEVRKVEMEDQETNKFLALLAQTNSNPYLIQVKRAQGVHIWDKSGKKYLDMIAGVAVNNIGHRHPKVISAIKNQVDLYLHVMVYGEFVQDAQNALAENLHSILPEELNCAYFVNSGAEAVEGALKLAKKATGRLEIISFNGSYHGSTHGALSVSSNESRKIAFEPLLPDIQFIDFNEIEHLSQITEKTAAVIMETIQGDAGVQIPSNDFMAALRDVCTKTGALLILDEIQCGMGRTGSMFAFEKYDIVPDILTLGKGLGGGMPIGAFVSSKDLMANLKHNPMLGHITTFGGHPVNAAAANACIEVLKSENWIDEVEQKGQLLEQLLISHPSVKKIRRVGLLLAIDMESTEKVEKTVKNCLQKGLIAFWFLSHPDSFRLSPPLCISLEEIQEAADIILESLNEI
jgi:acetylornithine/N-succinyldiaminopimelate aminotransferase